MHVVDFKTKTQPRAEPPDMLATPDMVRSENDLCDRLADAMPGEIIPYYVGMLAADRAPNSLTLCDWRRQRDAGASGALTPVKRGPKPAGPNPLAAEVALLQRNNADLARRLARADAIIAVQKKLADLLGIPMTPDGGVP